MPFYQPVEPAEDQAIFWKSGRRFRRHRRRGRKQFDSSWYNTTTRSRLSRFPFNVASASNAGQALTLGAAGTGANNAVGLVDGCAHRRPGAVIAAGRLIGGVMRRGGALQASDEGGHDRGHLVSCNRRWHIANHGRSDGPDRVQPSVLTAPFVMRSK